MRVLIANTYVPFCFGGAEMHALSLRDALRAEGHEAEIAHIPFKWYPPEAIPDHLMACRLLDLTEANGQPIDRLIGLRFPAYHVRHPNKALWILHQHRPAFDLWDSPQSDLLHVPGGLQMRDTIRHLEKKLLPEARLLYANSANVADRLRRFCALDAEPLYHPPPNADRYDIDTAAGARAQSEASAQQRQATGDDAEPFLFFPSRLNRLKRQDLVLKALARTRKPVRVRFAGQGDTAELAETFRQLGRKLKVDGRVQWLGHVSEDDKRRLYASCRGVVFPPEDEDYGYITLEAMLSGKPVVTCADSGGPLEFVAHEQTGLVADPDPDALAAAFDRLWSDPGFAADAGRAGRERYRALGVSWPNVVAKLLAPAPEPGASLAV